CWSHLRRGIIRVPGRSAFGVPVRIARSSWPDRSRMIRRGRSDSPAAPAKPGCKPHPAGEATLRPRSALDRASWIFQPGQRDVPCPLLPAHSVDRLHDAETRDMSAQTTVANGVDELSRALAD